ncbi:metallophosphoesterase family protein [Oceanirhabdus sp. W0125-5]|uniref:metallophosphoesterase family protein n=1 Tax=Oceanirhabdus sp. W0125-5 TaxID=2999116 RepID=UPI0022F34134|nr:metallophosphoesterase family protein [Oceanirhabdus sp. W0125-5]WBW96511.1 metallophosphoesterase family protein [Oceanirhabdus sp. W0125-5]
MKRIAILSDIHGNIQALESIVTDIKSKNLDDVICLGDTIAIGPNPKECLELILNENITLILGNHEEYFIEGTDKFPEVGSNETKHQEWIKSQLNNELRDKLKEKPFIIQKKIEGITFAFTHYARKNNKFIYINEERNIENLDKMFSNVKASVIFYGHEHHLEQTKLVGNADYICVGSSGCRKDNKTYYTLITIDDNMYTVEKVNIEYDREEFLNTFNNLNYPDKDLISKVFFGLGYK